MVFYRNNFYEIKNEYGFVNKIDFSGLRFFTIPQLNKWFVSRTSFMLRGRSYNFLLGNCKIIYVDDTLTY